MRVKFTEELRDIIKKSMPIIASTIDKFPEEIDDYCKVDDVEVKITLIGCRIDRDVIFSVSYTRELTKNHTIKFSAQISFQVKDGDINFKSYLEKELYGFSFTITRYSDNYDYDIASVKLTNVKVLDNEVRADAEGLALFIVNHSLVHKIDEEAMGEVV